MIEIIQKQVGPISLQVVEIFYEAEERFSLPSSFSNSNDSCGHYCDVEKRVVQLFCPNKTISFCFLAQIAYSLVWLYKRLLLLSHFSRVRLCVTPQTAATRLPCPWDSPGKNTGEGCCFLLQCMKVKVKSLSCVRLLATPWTATYQAPPSMGFSGQSTGVGCHCLRKLQTPADNFFRVQRRMTWKIMVTQGEISPFF